MNAEQTALTAELNNWIARAMAIETDPDAYEVAVGLIECFPQDTGKHLWNTAAYAMTEVAYAVQAHVASAEGRALLEAANEARYAFRDAEALDLARKALVAYLP